MNSKQALVPKLRFGEFEDEWSIGDLSSAQIKIIDGDRGVNYPNGDDFSDSGYCLFLSAKNVTKSGFKFEETSFISKEKDESLSKGKAHRNDLLLTTRGTIGNVAFFNATVPFDNIRINSGMVILRTDLDIISPSYLYNAFNSPILNKSVKRTSFGSAQPQLTVTGIKKFTFPHPSLPEQEKIAAFLTSVDDRIDQLKRKKSLLQDYKKGAMQKLFSQELRFKDEQGKDFPDWEEKKLGEVCLIRTGKKDVNEGNPNGIYPFFTCAKKPTFSDYFSFDTEAILIAGNGEVGHCLYYSGKFEAYQRTYVLSDFLLPAKYTFIYLNNFFREQVNKQKQMGAMPYIKLGMLNDFQIKVPTSSDEQTKIANFLSTLDQKIEQIDTQITQTQTFKKGLLQQMFV